MKKIVLPFCLLFVIGSYAQHPIQWAKCFGGYNYDQPAQIIQTPDGGFLTVGTTNGYNGDVSGNYGLGDFWLIKANAAGVKQWQKCYGGSSDDAAKAIEFTNDGGYILVGYTSSKDGLVTGIHDTSSNSSANYYDAWVVKIDSLGAVLWTKCYGGYREDVFNSVSRTTDGGYILCGYTSSRDGDVSYSYGNNDKTWVVKIDSVGHIQWQKTLGGTTYEDGLAAFQTTDGGYLIGNISGSNDGDVTDHKSTTYYYYNYWLVKLDSAGNKKWGKSYGGSNGDNLSAMINTHDGGCLMAGSTNSTTGDVFGSHGNGDAWLVKTDSMGDLTWQRCIGGTNQDVCKSIAQTNDGGYILLGNSWSQDGDVIPHNDSLAFWVTKINGIGYVQWEQFYGGSNSDSPASIITTTDNGYAFTGAVNLNAGQVSGVHGPNGPDYWVVKIMPEGTGIPEIPTINKVSLSPNPFSSQSTLTINGDHKNLSLTIYNLAGQELEAIAIGSNSTFLINRAELAGGLYFYQVTDPNGIIAIGKFIIE